MRRTPAILLLVAFAACTSAPTAPTTDSTAMAKPAVDSAAMRPINSPYAISYSSKFVMDGPVNAESVLALWKAYDDGDLSKSKDLLADSVDVNLANGAHFHLSRDSMVSAIQGVRSSFKSAVDRVTAIMAIKSTDKNEHWVTIWGTEVDTHKNGKVDSTDLQETWRFNASGKADMLLQYNRVAAPPKK
jgi:hypothetical protein